MIIITDPQDCCGCSACQKICPKKCITMQEDSEGFLYPIFDINKCIECGLCERTCPVINPQPPHLPLITYAAKNIDEQIRLQSSSGGVFTALAEIIIKSGGVIFGACFNENWEVIHNSVETIEDLKTLRGSKYVQSDMRDCYPQVKHYLDQKRVVLFSGTPCQISGLKQYLKHDYDTLLTVDFICHGVPSRKLWRMYLKEIKRYKFSFFNKKLDLKKISDISFRNKRNGWKNYDFYLSLEFEDYIYEDFYEPHHENSFMKAFLSDICLRPSCYHCPSKSGKSRSDITIADFWNIQDSLPSFDDNKGVSTVLINTLKGKRYYSLTNTKSIEIDYDKVQQYNGGFLTEIPVHKNRNKFFKYLEKKQNISSWIEEMLSEESKSKVFIKHFFNRL